ncbi:MAG: iron ABC transporter permease [Alphaproteobacteria bacterium]|nr:iron ABC transporter permease [Alphaproteobacteria bacterium]MCW5741708.1 iron ABC transporter permease [Alphaproteobacteria bacterium]
MVAIGASLPARRVGLLRRWSVSPAQLALAALIAAFLVAFLIVPVSRVMVAAFEGPTGFTLAHFGDFFRTSLFLESFLNSLYVAVGAVVLASLLSVPCAYFLARFDFRGAGLIQALGVVPLVMPPFVGAVAMQLIFGRNGTVNLLLNDWFGLRIPFMEGLNGVIFVEALHYFPFILLNLSASLANIDSSMEESAQNLGARGWTLFRRIVFPLAMPGYVAGAALVFVKVFDDLGTPLLLSQTNLLAPQAYLRITSVGLNDPMGYVISAILVAFSLIAMAASGLVTRGRDYATQQRGGGGLARRPLAGWRKTAAWSFILLVVVLSLSPHIGILLLSFATVWSFSPLPDAFTIKHYVTVFADSAHMMSNTLLYCGLAAGIDVVLGVSIAYLVARTKLPGRRLLDMVVMSSLAVPGLVIGIGYLRTYYGVELPGGVPLATFWGMLVIGYAIRRLPYALRACDAALKQVHESLEEAAENLGAGKLTALRRIVVPLITGGVLAGFVTSFATAAVELSETLLLVTRDVDAPISYGIYVYMQSAAGRGPGAALGVIAVVVVALGAWASHRMAERERSRRGRGGAT